VQQLPSTVRTAAALLSLGHYHPRKAKQSSSSSSSSAPSASSAAAVCAVGLDSSRGHAATGDSEGLVRLWDVTRAVSQGERSAREATLGERLFFHCFFVFGLGRIDGGGGGGGGDDAGWVSTMLTIM
jgi:hypothetical protein